MKSFAGKEFILNSIKEGDTFKGTEFEPVIVGKRFRAGDGFGGQEDDRLSGAAVCLEQLPAGFLQEFHFYDIDVTWL